MSSQWAVFAEGLSDLREFDGLKNEVRLAAVRAINTVARDGRASIARQIVRQVAFPASYVTPNQKRLYVSQQATKAKLEAKITARSRATSLARFVKGTPKIGERGVTVHVGSGKSKFMKRAFVIKLPAGSAGIDTKFNLGLAIRLRPGEKLQNKNKVRRMEKGLYLLYGPSVDQVFRSADGSGVASDEAPKLASYLNEEFLRLLEI